MLGGREFGGGRFSSPPKKLGLPPHNYISYGVPRTAGTAQLGGGIQRLQQDRSLFLLPIRGPNDLWWFMSHHNILRWTSPHRHRRSRILFFLFPLRRHPAPARWLTSSKCKKSRT